MPIATTPDYGSRVVNARSALADVFPSTTGAAPVEWRTLPGLSDYLETLGAMEARAAAIADGSASEAVWLVEHPPLYTGGTSAQRDDLIEARFPVHETGRGGQYTYHGPGQRVAYVMLDLKSRRPDLRVFVAALESWLIETIGAFGVRGDRREDRVGVWVPRPDKGSGFEDKIAAIGIRVRRWVSFHGVALNVSPDLGHFAGVVPCGVSEARYGVTSLADLGRGATMPMVDAALAAAFERNFGSIRPI